MIFGRSREALTEDARRERMNAMYEKSRLNFPDVAEITPEELIRLKEDAERTVVIVDVRAAEEQSVSMIEDAITAEEFQARRDDFEGATVVTYCTIGHRSGLYAKDLREQGWKVRNLRGAILGWTHAGGPLRDASGPTKRVHVWSPKVNLAADGYEPVW